MKKIFHYLHFTALFLAMIFVAGLSLALIAKIFYEEPKIPLVLFLIVLVFISLFKIMYIQTKFQVDNVESLKIYKNKTEVDVKIVKINYFSYKPIVVEFEDGYIESFQTSDFIL